MLDTNLEIAKYAVLLCQRTPSPNGSIAECIHCQFFDPEKCSAVRAIKMLKGPLEDDLLQIISMAAFGRKYPEKDPSKELIDPSDASYKLLKLKADALDTLYDAVERLEAFVRLNPVTFQSVKLYNRPILEYLQKVLNITERKICDGRAEERQEKRLSEEMKNLQDAIQSCYDWNETFGFFELTGDSDSQTKLRLILLRNNLMLLFAGDHINLATPDPNKVVYIYDKTGLKKVQ